MTALNALYTGGHQFAEVLDLNERMQAAARVRAIELLARTGIPAPEQRVDHNPHQLSGGQVFMGQQRIWIDRAVHSGPSGQAFRLIKTSGA